MIPADDRGSTRDIALGLIGALAPVLADVAPGVAVEIARDAAQILGLAGLDRLLAACAPHAGRPWPDELLPALERVRRLAARAFEAGSIAAFREADPELAGLADEVSALQWSPGAGSADSSQAVATQSLADTLDEMALADDASRDLARRARLAPPVAAALRAALDWLVGGSRRPVALRADDSVLEAQCEHVEFEGIAAAGEVLAAVQGNLGPALGGPVASWIVRVPLHTGSEVYLMLVHGGVPVAIPWHAVLRLRMAGATAVAERASLGEWPVIESPLGGRAPGAHPGEEAGDLPLALIAHGRKRGWLVADRLVWRLQAEPAESAEGAPAPGLTTMVETEEGERYWVAEPALLLHSIEAPPLHRAPVAAPVPRTSDEKRVAAPPSAPMPAAHVPAEPRAEVPAPAPVPQREEPVAPAPAPPHEGPPVHGKPHLRILRSEDVEPIEEVEPAADAAPVVPSRPRLEAARPTHVAPPRPRPEVVGPAPITPPPAPGRAPDSAPGARTLRTALVADDSIMVRVFLTRMLERFGFEVRAIETAAALRAEFERGTWSLACVDVELPDLPAVGTQEGAAFLAWLVSHYGPHTSFVALVRDTDDRVAATRAGIERMLRKPFDPAELEQVLRRLGLIAPRT
jgi:CheY-like chemotaxis protein